MSELPTTNGTMRKLWPTEADRFRDHLLRLDKENRRLRFAHFVSDSFIEDYASRMAEFGSVVYAYVLDGRVRAAAELRRLAAPEQCREALASPPVAELLRQPVELLCGAGLCGIGLDHAVGDEVAVGLEDSHRRTG